MNQTPSVDEHPLVTVVVPMFNAEDFIQECLSSLVEQSYPFLEVLCIDDGSTDSSEAKAREIAHEDTRVRVIRQENRGLSESRNRGIAMASGKYVLFVDADDGLRKEAIRHLVSCAEKHDAEVVVFGYSEVPQDSPVLSISRTQSGHAARGTEWLSPGLARLHAGFLEDWWEPRAQLLFLRRDFLDGSAVRFVPRLLHEDNLFTFQVLCRTQRLIQISDDFAIIRQTVGSVSRVGKTAHHVWSLVATLNGLASEIRSSGARSRKGRLGQRYVQHHVLDQAVDAYSVTPEAEKQILWLRLRQRDGKLPARAVLSFRMNTLSGLGWLVKGIRHHLWRALRFAAQSTTSQRVAK